MPGYVEDRWYYKPSKDPETGKTVRKEKEDHGKGKRYKVTGVPGVRSRSFPDGQKAAADKWLGKLLSEQMEHGDAYDPRRSEMLLRDYIWDEYWPHRGGDPATLLTVRSRLDHIDVLLGSYQLKQVRTPQLRAFLADLQRRIGPGTTLEVWGYLSSVMATAVDDERLRKNPCKAASVVRMLPDPPERLARAWARERVWAVRAALPARFQAMVDAGAGEGLRQGEVFGLALEDLDEAAEQIHVRRQVKKIGARLVFAPPKGGKTRTVPAPPHFFESIRRHLKDDPAKEVTLPWRDPDEPTTDKEAKDRAPRTFELIFTGVQGGALRRDSFNDRVWKPALVSAGVIPEPKRVRQGPRGRWVKRYAASREHGFHALRHTFASVMLDAREPIVAVCSWMGHADPSITLRIYAHMMPAADGRGRAAMQAWFEDQT